MPAKQTNEAFRIIALPGEEPNPTTKDVVQPPQPATKASKKKKSVAIRLSVEEEKMMRLEEKAEKEARKAQQAQERLARLQKRANKDNTVVATPATEDKLIAERGNLADITNSTVVSGARANDAQTTAGASTSKDKKTSNGKKRKQTTDDASDEVAESSKKTKTSEVTTTDAGDASTGATAPADTIALAANPINYTNNNSAPSGSQSANANATASNAQPVQATAVTNAPGAIQNGEVPGEAALPPRAISRAARAALMGRHPLKLRRVQPKVRGY